MTTQPPEEAEATNNPPYGLPCVWLDNQADYSPEEYLVLEPVPDDVLEETRPEANAQEEDEDQASLEESTCKAKPTSGDQNQGDAGGGHSQENLEETTVILSTSRNLFVGFQNPVWDMLAENTRKIRSRTLSPNGSQTEDKAPETEGKAPETEGKAPETEDKAPETEDKAPEMEDKAPEMEDKAPETVDVPEALAEADPATPEAEAPSGQPSGGAADPCSPHTSGSESGEDAKASNSEVEVCPQELTAGPPEVTEGPQEVTEGPQEVTEGPQEVTEGPQEVTTGPQVTEGPQVTAEPQTMAGKDIVIFTRDLPAWPFPPTPTCSAPSSPGLEQVSRGRRPLNPSMYGTDEENNYMRSMTSLLGGGESSISSLADILVWSDSSMGIGMGMATALLASGRSNPADLLYGAGPGLRTMSSILSSASSVISSSLASGTSLAVRSLTHALESVERRTVEGIRTAVRFLTNRLTPRWTQAGPDAD
ncbi:PREDICTED: uncharacterized protein C2orf57 homolog [Dipodomys ordii]|uniref:Uncharacterized protein C2orf57 homolog n=1 Tax=Dipodomys ordii TaxID=10020 RepID=A0A1S3FJE9_DIPOR|nr:PREDICTED: uncharacterized protein C2orf57 homolog [Dipodomys ordii]